MATATTASTTSDDQVDSNYRWWWTVGPLPVAIVIHALVSFAIMSVGTHATTTTTTHVKTAAKTAELRGRRGRCGRKASDRRSLVVASVLAFVDTFVFDEASELRHLRRVLAVHTLGFAQNMCVLTYWLIRIILIARRDEEERRAATALKSKDIQLYL